MMSFSANLGFLWTELSLPDAVRAAAAAGFDAVECHWPYETPADEVCAALDETGLPMLGINTVRGDVSAGENGLAALPGRRQEARAAIDQALEYASIVGSQAVHVMAGAAQGASAHDAFVSNLSYACDHAGREGKTVLIEPLNPGDAPGYFLASTTQGAELIESLDLPNLKLMFDCYHVGRAEGDVVTRMKRLLPMIGHVQIASVPERGPPDRGELFYPAIFDALKELGWSQPIGAEYKPNGPTDPTLGWLRNA